MQQPDFSQLQRVLNRVPAERPVLFEFYIDWDPIRQVLGSKMVDQDNPPLGWVKNYINAHLQLGYDAYVMSILGFKFETGVHKKAESVSQNEGAIIFDRKSFETYQWPDPDAIDVTKVLDEIQTFTPNGMKMIFTGGIGIMEAIVALVGFENLCYLMFEEPALIEDICNEIGTRLNRFFERCMNHQVVGAAIISDDWGFKSSTMISPEALRKFIFPWHKKMVETIHSHGKPAILHSCGQVEDVMEDIIEDLKYDAKHSFEDIILPVEQVYERWGNRIAILGGFDIDYLSRSKPEVVYQRAKAILEQTRKRGGYALGTGNSITNYIPMENYYAMASAAKHN